MKCAPCSDVWSLASQFPWIGLPGVVISLTRFRGWREVQRKQSAAPLNPKCPLCLTICNKPHSLYIINLQHISILSIPYKSISSWFPGVYSMPSHLGWMESHLHHHDSPSVTTPPLPPPAQYSSSCTLKSFAAVTRWCVFASDCMNGQRNITDVIIGWRASRRNSRYYCLCVPW